MTETKSSVVIVTDENFASEVLQSNLPVLIDFWAEWCGPCKMIAPLVEQLAEEYSGKLVVAKMDVQTNQEIPLKYGIRSIPTLLYFESGEIKATKVGAASKLQLMEFVNENLSNTP